MRRRNFMKVIAGSAAAWPLAARAQQPAVPVIGWLSGISSNVQQPQLAAFRQVLGGAGFTEGRKLPAASYQSVRLKRYDALS